MPCTIGRPPMYGPGFRYGHGIRAATAFSGFNSSCVTRPLGQRRRVTGRTGSHTSRARARSSAGAEHAGKHQGVVERVVWPSLRDAPVLRPGFPVSGCPARVRAVGSVRRCTSRCRSVARPRPVRPRRPETHSRIPRCAPRVCGPGAASISSPAISANVGWSSSISAVRPWTCVGPGSTPGLSRLTTECSTRPSASRASAATLMTRAWLGWNPDVSTSTTAQPSPGSVAGRPQQLPHGIRMARSPDNPRVSPTLWTTVSRFAPSDETAIMAVRQLASADGDNPGGGLV